MPSVLSSQIFGFAQLKPSLLCCLVPRCPGSVFMAIPTLHLFLHLYLGCHESQQFDQQSPSANRETKCICSQGSGAWKSEMCGDLAAISLIDFSVTLCCYHLPTQACGEL